MQLWHHQMLYQLNGTYGAQAYKPDGGFDDFDTELLTLLGRLQLIAPSDIWSKAETLRASGAATALTLALPDMYSKKRRENNVHDYHRHLVTCLQAMRADLGISEGHDAESDELVSSKISTPC